MNEQEKNARENLVEYLKAIITLSEEAIKNVNNGDKLDCLLMTLGTTLQAAVFVSGAASALSNTDSGEKISKIRKLKSKKR